MANLYKKHRGRLKGKEERKIPSPKSFELDSKLFKTFRVSQETHNQSLGETNQVPR